MQRLVSFQKILEPPLQKMELYFQISTAELKDTFEFFILGFLHINYLFQNLYKVKKSKLSLKKRQHH